MRVPMRAPVLLATLVFAALVLAACGGTARLPVSAGYGPDPALPPPRTPLVPAVELAPAVGWRHGQTPTPARGTVVNAYATGFDHPRWLYVLPNGDVLVAETSAPPRPAQGGGIKGWFMKQFMKLTGSAVPSANRITLLRDADDDGVAEVRSDFLTELHSPFGMALVDDVLYVANTDALVRFPYEEGQLRITAPPTLVAPLPAGPINYHWTKNVLPSADGRTLYVAVGSNSNIAENGLEAEEGRAAIWAIDAATGAARIVATGLRNPVGMAWVPETGALWTAVNERDELTGDLVPDFMTAVQEGAFYGWPFSYFGQHPDPRMEPQRPDLVARAVVPDYALGPHTSSMGLAYVTGAALPAPFTRGMLVGQHGSWNRKPLSGYRVIFVPFADGRPAGPPIELLGGFLNQRGQAQGRPVGVVVDGRGAVLVADDVGNVVWRVSRAGGGR